MEKTIKKATLTNGIVFLWQNQARQYPRYGTGITYFKGLCEDNMWVDCLLYYGYDNELHGILNHYPSTCHHIKRLEALTSRSDLIEDGRESHLHSLTRQ